MRLARSEFRAALIAMLGPSLMQAVSACCQACGHVRPFVRSCKLRPILGINLSDRHRMWWIWQDRPNVHNGCFLPHLESMWDRNSPTAVGCEDWDYRDIRLLVSSTGTFSCTCPRLLLVHSMAQRRRAVLMATLRKEAASVHSALPSLNQTPTSAEAINPAHPNWPHRMLALLSEALCNRSVPLPAANRRTLSICDHQQSQKQQGCVPEALVQRLWKITSYVETVLRSSL